MNSISSVQPPKTPHSVNPDSAKQTASAQPSEQASTTQSAQENAPRELTQNDLVDVQVGPLETPDAGPLWKQSSAVETFSSPDELVDKIDTFLEENRHTIEHILAANGIAEPEEAAELLINQIRASAQTNDQFDFDLNSYVLDYKKTSGSWSVTDDAAMLSGPVMGQVQTESAVRNQEWLSIHFDKSSGEASLAHQSIQFDYGPKTTALAASGRYSDAIQVTYDAAFRAENGDFSAPTPDDNKDVPAKSEEQSVPGDFIEFDVKTQTNQARRLDFQGGDQDIQSLLSQLLAQTSPDADEAYGSLYDFIQDRMDKYSNQFSKSQLEGAVTVTKFPSYSSGPGSNVDIAT